LNSIIFIKNESFIHVVINGYLS